MDKANASGRSVNAESVCRLFERDAQSLIEEPEVCQCCAYYEDGLCLRPED